MPEIYGQPDMSSSVRPRTSLPSLSVIPSQRRRSGPPGIIPPVQSLHPSIVEPSPVDSVGTASTSDSQIEDEEQEHEDEEEDSDRGEEGGNTVGQEEKQLGGNNAFPRIGSVFHSTATSRPMASSPASFEKHGTSEKHVTSRSRDRPENRTLLQSGTQPTDKVSQTDHQEMAPPVSDIPVFPIEENSKAVPSPGSSRSASTTTSPRSAPSTAHRSVMSDNTMLGTGGIAKRRSLGRALDTTTLAARILTLDAETPRAQTLEEAEEKSTNPVQSSTELAANVTGSPTSEHGDSAQKVFSISQEPQGSAGPSSAIAGLEDGFSKCWTLCNSLAQLSSQHRMRVFQHTGQSQLQEQAWNSCWELCQNLYQSRQGGNYGPALPALELCRDFCQALFHARYRSDERSDSVLRVMWELQNHLYNIHDRNLPNAFQERTLEFFVALCHRLMKQRTSLPEETEALLRSCWTLAEMLFSLRHNSRDGKADNEELLGSAVQACWELCDLFRQGWTQARPDKTTPRASQIGFVPSYSSLQSFYTPRLGYGQHPTPVRPFAGYSHGTQAVQPETPTTIFDENPMDSVEDRETPDILVLGPVKNQSTSGKASSSVSMDSEPSSHPTSTTATAPDPRIAHLSNIRVLLVQAAMIVGFQGPRNPPLSTTASTSSSTKLQWQQIQQHNSQALLTFTRALPSTIFGTQPWQLALVDSFKKMILSWPSLIHSLGRGASAEETLALLQSERTMRNAEQIARSVVWMMTVEQYAWLSDLFRVVFGCAPDDEDLDGKKSVLV